MSVHIYRAADQPATRWVDYNLDKPHVFKLKPQALVWCGCCYKQRMAKNCIVHQYYDCTLFWCAQGKGCKGEREITAARNKLFRVRSDGAKRGWKTRKASQR